MGIDTSAAGSDCGRVARASRPSGPSPWVRAMPRWTCSGGAWPSRDQPDGIDAARRLLQVGDHDRRFRRTSAKRFRLARAQRGDPSGCLSSRRARLTGPWHSAGRIRSASDARAEMESEQLHFLEARAVRRGDAGRARRRARHALGPAAPAGRPCHVALGRHRTTSGRSRRSWPSPRRDGDRRPRARGTRWSLAAFSRRHGGRRRGTPRAPCRAGGGAGSVAVRRPTRERAQGMSGRPSPAGTHGR